LNTRGQCRHCLHSSPGPFHRDHLPQGSSAAPVLRRDGQGGALERADLEKEDPGHALRAHCHLPQAGGAGQAGAGGFVGGGPHDARSGVPGPLSAGLLLDFLELANTYSEQDLEAAILRELERFLLEVGTDFSFIARQKRMTIGDRDFYLYLLFYHRSLRRLAAIELKLGSFDPAHKGQMELYLRWLDRYERRPGEDMPIGLILCGEKNRAQIELLQLDRGEIRVAEYLVELPPREMLEAKLHEAIWLARGQVEASSHS